MLRNQEPTLLDLTRQRRRLYGCGAAFGLSFVAVTAAPVAMAYELAPLAFVLFGVGAVVLLASAAYALRTIRCPTCHLPLLQFAFGELPLGNWLEWLLNVRVCPRCRFSASSPGDASAAGLTTAWSGS